ncbi:MAG: extracellular solute-binding protein [Lacrimispora sp.]|uniref:extracellular solute-binding protein n=1 Tax=Lacrimispora sp. TaxID=2719234 RepID=UPI0039E63655
MKKYWIRGTAVLAAASVVFMAGCSKKAEQQPVKAVEGSAGAYEDTLTCRMGRSTIANPKFPEGDTYEDNAYTRYLMNRLNVKVVNDFEANGADYDRQVSLAIASGELPDVMKVGSKDVLDELVENGLVEDLTDVYNQYASDNIKAIYDSYDGRCLDMATYDGRLMAIPGTNLDSAPSVTYVRKDWLEKLGLKVDEDGDKRISIEELEMIASTFVEKDPGNSGNPVGMAFVPYLTANDDGSSGYAMNAIAAAFQAHPKVWLEDESGTVYYGSATPQMKEALAQMAQWFEKGIVDPQFGTRTWDDITALLTNGQTGIAFGPWHIPDWLLNNVRAMDSGAEFAAYAIADQQGNVNAVHSNSGSGYMVVRKGYSNPEVLIKMTNLYFDEMVNNKNLAQEEPEVANYISQGVDGTARPISLEVNAYTSLLDDYSDISRCVNGEITLDEVKTAESKSIVDSAKKYLANPEQAETADWSKYTSRMEGVNLIDHLTKEGYFSWKNPVFWGITETMKSNGANLGTLEEEAFVAIVTGARPVEDFESYFVASWKQQGGGAIAEEIQSEVDGGDQK